MHWRSFHELASARCQTKFRSCASLGFSHELTGRSFAGDNEECNQRNECARRRHSRTHAPLKRANDVTSSPLHSFEAHGDVTLRLRSMLQVEPLPSRVELTVAPLTSQRHARRFRQTDARARPHGHSASRQLVSCNVQLPASFRCAVVTSRRCWQASITLCRLPERLKNSFREKSLGFASSVALS